MKSEHKRYFRSIIRHITPGIIVVSLVLCVYNVYAHSYNNYYNLELG